jgi:hypothetical protein
LFILFIELGTDGHLRLADFGLSKIISSVSPNTSFKKPSRLDLNGDELNVSRESFQKIQKFLPLRLSKANADIQKKVKKSCKVILMRSDMKSDVYNLLKDIGVDVFLARTKSDAEGLVKTHSIEAIFMDVDHMHNVCCDIHTMNECSNVLDHWKEDIDGIELLKHFCSTLFNSIPVYIISQSSANLDMKAMFRKEGAKKCFTKPLEASHIANIRMLFEKQKEVSNIHNFNSFNSKHVKSDNSSIKEDVEAKKNRIILTKTIPISEKNDSKNDRIKNIVPTFNSPDKSLKSYKAPSSALSAVNTSLNGPKLLTKVHSKNWKNLTESQLHTAVGTLHFLAPEVIKLHKMGKSVDWWACGITFYYCLTREYIFKGEKKEDIFEHILKSQIDSLYSEELLRSSGMEIKDLIQGLLNKDVKKRLGTLGAEQVKSHNFFKKTDWSNLSNCDPDYIPAQFVYKKSSTSDQKLFYGEKLLADTKSVLQVKNSKNKKNKNKNKINIYRSNYPSMTSFSLTAEPLLEVAEEDLDCGENNSSAVISGYNNSENNSIDDMRNHSGISNSYYNSAGDDIDNK